MMTRSSVEKADWRPAHVSDRLCWDQDIAAFSAELDDPFIAAARLHEGPDIVYARVAVRNHPGWVLTRYDHIEDAFMRPGDFSSAAFSNSAELLGVDWTLVPLQSDPPAHHHYRMVLQPMFQPRAIGQLEPMVRETCRELISAFEHKGECEFMSDFAKAFPSYIFLGMMGMPKDMLPQFLAWESQYLRGETRALRVQAIREIVAYMEGFAKERSRNPRDDLVSKIVTAEINGRKLSHGEVMGMCTVLYIGGLDTVLSSLGWYFRYLATDLPLQKRLRENPSDIPAAVNELLRAHGVTGTMRVVTRDLEFHGVTMKKDDWLILPTYLAGRDPRKFDRPHEIDIDRDSRQLTLATGIHNCLGSHLAKREIKVVLEEWLSRFKDIQLPAGETSSWHTEAVWGVDHLPLSWTR